MTTRLILFALTTTLIAPRANQAQSPEGNAISVTVDNFLRAESDLYLSNMVKNGSLGRFVHRREPAPIDNQITVHPTRDTLYSAAVFDLDAGPATITLPDVGKRFISMQVINEDNYIPVMAYGAGTYTLDKKNAGTRYVATAVRTVVDPLDSKDLERGHALQDAIKIEQPDPGKFEVPNWDQASQKKIRDALVVLGLTVLDLKQAFGAKDQVDPVRHLIGTALRWGGSPNEDAKYLSVTPGANDGITIHRVIVKDVPVDGFWAISIDNAKSRFEEDAGSLNDITAKKGEDGSIAIQFGGCDGKIANCLPITPGWAYTVRLYRPRREILDGTWKFPGAQPVK